MITKEDIKIGNLFLYENKLLGTKSYYLIIKIEEFTNASVVCEILVNNKIAPANFVYKIDFPRMTLL